MTAVAVGSELSEGFYPEFQIVLYLNISELEDMQEDIKHLPWKTLSNKQSLLIVDNWHTRPECHKDFEILIKQAHFNGLAVLLVSTQYETDSSEDEILKMFSTFPSVQAIQHFNSISWVDEIAKGMIDKVLSEKIKVTGKMSEKLALGNLDDCSGYFVDIEDYKQALVFSSKYKKLRGNLRYLSWRLNAWNPSICHLKEVSEENVLKHISDAIITPYNSYLSTLESISAISQWELPYIRALSKDEPKGIMELQTNNIVVPILLGKMWQMDATDAYLILRCLCEDDWAEDSLIILKEYLQNSPKQIPQVIWNIQLQCNKKIETSYPDQSDLYLKTKLISGLLLDENIRKIYCTYFIEETKKGNINIYYQRTIICNLLSNTPGNTIKVKERLDIVNDLLPIDIAQTMGKNARDKPIQNVMWFLFFLEKDKSLFKPFVMNFLNGYGEDNLVTALNATKSGRTQRNILRIIQHFDSSLREKIKLHTNLAPNQKSFKNRIQFLQPIIRATVKWGESRNRAIDFLMNEINEEELTFILKNNQSREYNLFLLLHSAIWLSQDAAKRIATMIPNIFKKLGFQKVSAKHWGYLIENILIADRDSAENILDLFNEISVNQLIAVAKAEEIGKFIRAIEKVRPGTINKWCTSSSDIEFFKEVIPLMKEDELINEILIELCVFAPKFFGAIFKTYDTKMHQWLISSHDSWQLLTRLGIFLIAAKLNNNESIVPRLKPSLSEIQNLSGCKPGQFLAAIYAIQNLVSESEAVEIIYKIMKNMNTDGTIPFWFSHINIPWNVKNIAIIIREILRMSSNFMLSEMQDIIYMAHLNQYICRPLPLQASNSKDKAIATAIHVGTVKIINQVEPNTICVVPNYSNPYVNQTVKNFEEILKPIPGQGLTIKEWYKTVLTKNNLMDRNYWQIKLLRMECIKWDLEKQNNQLKVFFKKKNEK